MDEKSNVMKKVLLTGSSGFLGKYLLKACEEFGFSAVSVGRSSANQVVCDLKREVPQIPKEEFDQVIFAAGKAHMIPKTEAEKKDFFDVNVTGLKHFLDGLVGVTVKQFVFISTVSVYGRWNGTNLVETDPLLSEEPYGKSKIEAEKMISEWGIRHQVPVIIFRIPLLAGANPPGNLGDMMKAIERNRYPRIGRGSARKSMVLAEDVALFCLSLKGQESGIYQLTDQHHPSFYEVEMSLRKQLNKSNIIVIPAFAARLLAFMGDFLPKFPIDSLRYKKMTLDLTFDSRKAEVELGWKPRRVIDVDFLKN
jgi:nucleoside-diphosphate-sugar epimerase